MKKLLIVEDHPMHLRLLEMTLANKNYTLLKAIDGKTALEMAARERPDLILMDIRLPNMNGFEVTRELRKNSALRKTPIIAITAHAMNADRENATKSGCDIYLTKPIDTRMLPMLINEMLRKRRRAVQSEDKDNE